jgi:hypothetical protein
MPVLSYFLGEINVKFNVNPPKHVFSANMSSLYSLFGHYWIYMTMEAKKDKEDKEEKQYKTVNIDLEENDTETVVDYRKYSIQKLKSIVTERELATDVSKLKKNDLATGNFLLFENFIFKKFQSCPGQSLY